MKSILTRWLARVAFAALVAAAMLVLGPQPAPANICNAPEQPGFCPPFNDDTCYDWCIDHEYLGGGCIPNEQSGCCTCLIR
jgi:hypothetical protein